MSGEWRRAGEGELVGAEQSGAITDPARANTRAQVWYEAHCWKCGAGPDLDGQEWRLSEESALRAAVDEAEWKLAPDGRLYCEDCPS